MTTSSGSCNVCGNDNLPQAAFCMTCGTPMEVSALDPLNLTGLLPQDQLLKQRYRILAQIGRGGFAAVYQAEDLHFHHRLVAVKEMSQSGLSPKERAEAIAILKWGSSFPRQADGITLCGIKGQNLLQTNLMLPPIRQVILVDESVL